jgi:hypothetical protein
MSDLEKINQPSVTSALIELSKNPDIDPQKIEQLMNLQLKMEDRQAEKSFNTAMAAFQGECPVIVRNKKTDFESKSGGKVKYDYAPLDQIVSTIKPLLAKNGLSFTFTVSPSAEKATTKITTTIYHQAGHKKEFCYTYDSIHDDGRMNSSQRRKSALTYAKRAALENALGIVTAGEDDDAKRALDNPASQEQIDKIKKLIVSTGSKEDDLLFYLGLDSMESLSDFDAKKAINALNQKRNIASAKKKV